MNSPVISDDPLYQLLRNDDVTGFNKARSEGQSCNLEGCDLRGIDLRHLIISGMSLENTYFRGADLRGIDFRGCNLAGASLANAQISGCYFPAELPPEEIQLSVSMGTRLRHIFNIS
jgi:uncharacterized protein YjbI with pentapeptide repeats